MDICKICGDHTLESTAGICPRRGCAKSMLNGPCGGVVNGMCEVDLERIKCIWITVFDLMTRTGKIDKNLDIRMPKTK